VTFDAFKPMPERMHGELEERLALGDRALSFGMSFLDDYLLALLPHDLVLLGAPTGVGKTDLALQIAARNATAGNHTHYFALEAEPRELERRRKYALLADEAKRCKLPGAAEMNYRAWHLGRCEHIVGKLNAWADRKIAEELGHLHTYYRGQNFNARDLTRWILEIHSRTTLIVVDHLHYVDAGEDDDENRALHDTVKAIRDITLRIGRPIIVVAHLRKKDERAKKLIADYNDFHGSSNITKIATQVITLERALDIEPAKWWLSPTFMAITKDRLAGAPRVVALTNFNMTTKSYAPEYTLGKAKGTRWEPISDPPSWAKHHRSIAPPPAQVDTAERYA
jgi:hypothetical protein